MALARLVALSGDLPVLHATHRGRRHAVESALFRDERLDQKLGATLARHLPCRRRLSGLVVENDKPAILHLVDPVGAGGEGDTAGRTGDLDDAIYLAMASLYRLAAIALLLDEPSCDGLEGRPPEMPHRREPPVWLEFGAAYALKQIVGVLAKRAVGRLLQKFLEHFMHQTSAKRRVGRLVKLVLLVKIQNLPGVDGVGVVYPSVDLGGRESARTRRHRRCRPRARNGLEWLFGRERAKHIKPHPAAVENVRDVKRGKHGLKAFEPAAGDCHGIGVAGRPCYHDLLRTGRHPHVVRAEPGAPVVGLKPDILPHLGVHPGVEFGARRPDGFVETAKNDSVGVIHARLERAVDRKARVVANRRPYLGLVHEHGEYSGKGCRLGLEVAAMFDKRDKKPGRHLALLRLPQPPGAVIRVRAARDFCAGGVCSLRSALRTALRTTVRVALRVALRVTDTLRRHAFGGVAKPARKIGETWRRARPDFDKRGKREFDVVLDECAQLVDARLAFLVPVFRLAVSAFRLSAPARRLPVIKSLEDALDSGIGPVAAKKFDLKPSCKLQEIAPLHAARAQGML